MTIQSKYLRINDPIHGTIQFPKDGLIHKLIDSREFQRLRRIKQLGTVDFVYPCATHTRFSHSIGVAHLVEKAAKELLYKKDSSDVTIFQKLREEGYFESYDNENQVILALTCAGLLHDIGHTPFSHTLENYFYKKDHIKNTIELIEIDTEVCSILDSSIEGHYGDDQKLPSNVKNDIISLIRHDKLKNNALSPLSDLISCQLDCDRLDYIQRDNYFCGTPIKIDCDYIIKCMMLEKVIYIDNKYKIVFLNNAISAIEHFLMSRWIHYKQIINHKTCLATEVMLTKIVGYKASTTDVQVLDKLRTFSNTDLSIKTLNEFIDSDDNQIYGYIKKIVSDNETEPILRHWCTCFLKRKIPKLIQPPIKRSDGKRKLDEYMSILRRKILFSRVSPVR